MTSFASNIATILSVIATVNPNKTLDVGSGFGKFGLLTRELLLSIKADKEDICPKDNLTIDCAEEAEYFYKQPYHDKIYNNHWHEDVLKMPIEKINGYDLILLIDVAEHWDKDIALDWLKKINTNVLISTPKHVVFYEKEYYKSRKHVSQWAEEDFRNLGEINDYSTKDSFIYLKLKK